MITSFELVLCCTTEQLLGHEAAQCRCLFVHVDICREKLKYGNAMFTKQEGGRFTALSLVIVGISAILVDISCLLLTPVSLSEKVWGPQDVNFWLERSGEAE